MRQSQQSPRQPQQSPKKIHPRNPKALVYAVETDQPDIENESSFTISTTDTYHESKSDAGEDDPGLTQSMADTGNDDPGPVDAAVARERLNDLRLTINSSPGVFLLAHMRLSSNTVLSVILKLSGFVIIMDSIGRKNFHLGNGSEITSTTTEYIMD